MIFNMAGEVSIGLNASIPIRDRMGTLNDVIGCWTWVGCSLAMEEKY
jgi:hypothetical protein